MDKKITIYSKVSLSLEDNNCLMLLYLPLVGSDPIILYQFLNALLDKQRLCSNSYTEDELLGIIGWKLRKFTDARGRLEAIGLLETYIDRYGNYKLFIKSPLTCKNFIKDCTFGVFLKYKIGEELFKNVTSLVELVSVDVKDDTNISKHFEEVFNSVIDDNECIEGNFRGKKPSRGANLSTDSFDLDLFISKVDTNYLKDGLTFDLKKKFNAIAYTYGFSMEQMVNLYNESVNNEGVFKIDTFSKKASNAFNYLNDNPVLKLEDKDKVNGEADILANMNANDLLLELKCDPTFVDLNINKMRKIYELVDYEPGIINYMIVKVFKEKETIPSPNYFVKIAESWKENGIYSREDAYNYVINGVYPLVNNKRLNNNYNKKNNNNNNGYKLEDWQIEAINNTWNGGNLGG